MVSALPKRKPRPRITPEPRLSPKGLPGGLKIVLITFTLFIVFWFLSVVVEGELRRMSVKKNQYLKYNKVLREERLSLQRELEKLTSPLSIQKLAEEQNMVLPTKVYHLKVGDL